MFYAPSELFKIKPRVWISTVALFMAGLTSALSLLPVIPEMIQESYIDENISKHLNRQVHRDILNDHISGLYNCFFACGNTVGPLVGNWLYTQYD